ncbi:hypothetical protein [Paenibacillus sp. SI8]|uniref:phage baseplate plug family protein n=1 Tax=unclassified Paenibacillus TaxID=185978 RepID=UPI0034661FEA
MEYIDIEKSLIPYRFDINLAGETFTFEVHYNGDYDFFSTDLSKNGETLVHGERIVYGMPLFGDVADARFPSVRILPYDLSGNSNDVTWATLSESVFLYVDGESLG